MGLSSTRWANAKMRDGGIGNRMTPPILADWGPLSMGAMKNKVKMKTNPQVVTCTNDDCIMHRQPCSSVTTLSQIMHTYCKMIMQAMHNARIR